MSLSFMGFLLARRCGGRGDAEPPGLLAVVVVPVVVAGAAQPVGRGRDRPGPVGEPASTTGPVGAVADQQVPDRPGGLPVQLALALLGSQAADLDRDVGRGAADGPVGVDDHDLRTRREQRPGAALAARRGGGRAERQVDPAIGGGDATLSKATGWPPS
jgi:hypothetical protein